MTAAAARAFADSDLDELVSSTPRLVRAGWTASAVRAQIDSRRWQRVGRAVVRHNGPLAAPELRAAALVVLGPRAVLTSFTALEVRGLRSWERERVHVLVPRGARVRVPSELPVCVHYTGTWLERSPSFVQELDGTGQAAVLAAAAFSAPRPPPAAFSLPASNSA